MPDGLHLHGPRQRLHNPQTGHQEKESADADIRRRNQTDQPTDQDGHQAPAGTDVREKKGMLRVKMRE